MGEDPRLSMPAELHHPHAKFSNWKFKLFRVKSMERAPLPGDVQPETGALAGVVTPSGPGETVEAVVGLPGSVLSLCLGSKSKENVEGPEQRVDLKLQEMDTHMNHLRSVNAHNMFDKTPNFSCVLMHDYSLCLCTGVCAVCVEQRTGKPKDRSMRSRGLWMRPAGGPCAGWVAKPRFGPRSSSKS